jgi:signal transduction histidine kinase
MPRMASRANPWAGPSRSPGAGAVGIVAAAASTAMFVATVLGATSDPPMSLVERSLPAWTIVLGLLAGLAVIGAAWMVSLDRPAVAVALAVTSAGLLVPTWAGNIVFPPAAQAAALATAPLAVAGVSQVGLRWSQVVGPSGLTRVIYALAFAAVIVLAAGYDPLSDPGCNLTCAHVHPPLAVFISTRTAYLMATAVIAFSGILACIELVREAPGGRSGVVLWATLLALIVLITSWIAHAVSWTDWRTTEAVMLPAVVAGLLVGIAPLVATASIRRKRLAVRELVEHLSDTGLAAGADGGSNLRVQYALPDDGRWVGASGQDIETGAEPARAIVISDAGRPALRLEVPGGEDAGEILATLTPATMLALQNARLAAVSRARLADVRASQRRIVDASDTERQRIERDLHDGAQQRLVGASFQLSLARARLATDGETLSRAEASVHEALERLRILGHGIFPATIATEGLGAALEDLARAADLPTKLEIRELGPELERDVALAAYAVVSTALAQAGRLPGSVSTEVGAALRDGTLALRVQLIGGTGLEQDDLVDVADRVGALGGHLDVEPIDGGVAITAVMPCA